MSELISGKEALDAWYEGLEIEVKHSSTGWFVFNDHNFGITVFKSEDHQFRLKPRTVNLNGIELPACGVGYKPNTYMFILNSLDPNEYSKVILDESDEIPAYWWRTEDEIKQVVAALRSVFGKK